MRLSERLRATFIGLCEVGLVLTALFSVATAFNEWHRFLELGSHFRVQYLVTALLLTIVFVVADWRRYALLGVATVVFNAWFIVPWYLPVTDVEQSDSDIRILLSNVLVSNGEADRFIAFVEESAPDMIVMQEVTPAWMQMIAAIDAFYPYKLVEARDDPFGVALYSKFPLDSTVVNSSVPLGYPELIVRAIAGPHRLNLITTHPIPPIGENNFFSRNLQLDGVAKLAARTPEPTILIGDLNITMWSNHYDRLEEISGLGNARRGFGIKPTWPLFLPIGLIPIDHCLVSDDITVTGFRTGPNIGSDHLPIVVSLTLD